MIILETGLCEDTVRARNFASLVCSAVYSVLNSVAAKYAGSRLVRHLDHHHLAAICITGVEGGVVTPICLATGSAVIHRKNLSSRGRTIKDSQAETLVFRGLRRYLLGQVALFLDRKASIFQDFSAEGKLRLKPGVGFHLFLTHMPSGSSSFGKGKGHTENTGWILILLRSKDV